MNTIVIYKSKYGTTKRYAEWIAEELGCAAIEASRIKPEDMENYDVIIYGGGLYAECIDGIALINKNYDRIKDKNIIVFSVGLTDPEFKRYYDTVAEKNFSSDVRENIQIFNLPGRMIIDELSLPHRGALKALRAFLKAKPSLSPDMQMLFDLCGESNDFVDKNAIDPIAKAVRAIEKD